MNEYMINKINRKHPLKTVLSYSIGSVAQVCSHGGLVHVSVSPPGIFNFILSDLCFANNEKRLKNL